jgi:hypothetical protein
VCGREMLKVLMVSFQKVTLIALTAFLALCSSPQASEFLRICKASLPKTEAFLAECKRNARHFRRDFYPGGHGPSLAEDHAVWFDSPHEGSYFGFGCVLGPRDQVEFLGIYFTPKPLNFGIANSALFTFVDSNGNVGLRSPDGRSFVLLAIHKFTPPKQERNFREGNCEIGRFDPHTNETVDKIGDWFSFYKVQTGQPIEITHCTNREVKYDIAQCSTLIYKSFINTTNSTLIYGALSYFAIIISEEARLYIDSKLLERLCRQKTSHPIEYMNFVVELCDQTIREPQ